MDIKQEAEEFLAKWTKEDDKKIKIALFGQPGAGKSSLINAIVGQDLATVSNTTDTTKATQVIEYNGVVFVDLPGYDTSLFPENKYFSQFDPLQYDLFICVFSGKLHGADTNFFKLLKKEGRTCIFVRNKKDGIYDPGKTIEESQKEIIDDVSSQVGEAVSVSFTSCRKDMEEKDRGITALEKEILKNLDPALEEKFLRTAKAYTIEILDKKRDSARKFINSAMIKGAVNGLNPIVGVDMGIDVKIMQKMYEHIRQTFDITEQGIQNSDIQGIMVDLIKKGLSKDAITSGLKKVLTESMEKKLSKYIPYIGQVTAMGVGAGTMYYLGYEYVDACYEYAQKRLEQEIAKSREQK